MTRNEKRLFNALAAFMLGAAVWYSVQQLPHTVTICIIFAFWYRYEATK